MLQPRPHANRCLKMIWRGSRAGMLVLSTQHYYSGDTFQDPTLKFPGSTTFPQVRTTMLVGDLLGFGDSVEDTGKDRLQCRYGQRRFPLGLFVVMFVVV